MSKFQRFIFSIVPLTFLLFPTQTFAQETGLGFRNDIPASKLVTTVLGIAIGVAGGVGFLLLVYGGFKLVSSQGDPKALQEARGVITAALSGLLFIVFSVFILRLIGVTILGLPL